MLSLLRRTMGERARWKRDIFHFLRRCFDPNLEFFWKGKSGTSYDGLWVFMHMCEMVRKRWSVCLCIVWVFWQTWVSKVLMFGAGSQRSTGTNRHWDRVLVVLSAVVNGGPRWRWDCPLRTGSRPRLGCSRRWSSPRPARTPDRRPLHCLLRSRRSLGPAGPGRCTSAAENRRTTVIKRSV